MKQTLHILYAALLLTLAGCGGRSDAPAPLKDSNGGGGNSSERPVEFITRSTTGGDEELKTIFTNGTEIGISVNDYNEYTNVKYKYQDGKFVRAEPDKAIFIGEGKEEQMKQATYTAYYPYSPDGDYDSPTIMSDQKETERYYASDALIATGKLGELMKFDHRMAKVIITTPEAVQSVSIGGQPLQEDGNADQTIQAYNAEGDGKTWRTILVPGTRTLAVDVTKKNGDTFTATFEDKELQVGGQHTFSVTDFLNIPANATDMDTWETGHEETISQSGTYNFTGKCEDGKILISKVKAEITLNLYGTQIKQLKMVEGQQKLTINLYGTNRIETFYIDTDWWQPGPIDITLKGHGNAPRLEIDNSLEIYGLCEPALKGRKLTIQDLTVTGQSIYAMHLESLSITRSDITLTGRDQTATIGTPFENRHNLEISNINLTNCRLSLGRGGGNGINGPTTIGVGCTWEKTGKCGTITIKDCTITPLGVDNITIGVDGASSTGSRCGDIIVNGSKKANNTTYIWQESDNRDPGL